jgi:hypothetical protein
MRACDERILSEILLIEICSKIELLMNLFGKTIKEMYENVLKIVLIEN